MQNEVQYGKEKQPQLDSQCVSYRLVNHCVAIMLVLVIGVEVIVHREQKGSLLPPAQQDRCGRFKGGGAQLVPCMHAMVSIFSKDSKQPGGQCKRWVRELDSLPQELQC